MNSYEEHEHYLSVIEQFGNLMPGGFFICKADGNGELLYANKAVWNIFGCETLEEFRSYTGFKLRGVIHPDDYAGIQSLIDRQLEAGKPDSGYMEYRIIRRDKKVRWIDEYSYYMGSDLHKGLYYVFISDITEKRCKDESDRAMRAAVIEALTRAYDSVWLITDMEAQRFELYRIDSVLAHLMPASEAVKITRFSDALEFYSKLVYVEDRQQFLTATSPDSIVRGLENKTMYSVPFRRVFETGVRYYRLEFAKLNLGNAEDNIVAGFRDVDEEVRKDQQIQHSLAVRAAVIEAFARVYDSVWLLHDMETEEFELYRINKERAHQMPAYEADRLERFSDAFAFYSRFILEEDRQRFLSEVAPDIIFENTEKKPIYSVPFRRVFDTGIRYYRVDFARLDVDNGENGVVAGFKDVDEEVRKDKRLHEALREAINLAETDLMTGIYNRMTGENKVSDLIGHGGRGMFVLFDIDHFKQFNDTYGHNVGDQVIIAVANCLKNTFRGGDIVMRLGGDEFAAFAAGIYTREIGEKILMRFYDSLNNAVIREGMQKISVSTGVAFTSGQCADNFLHLYESADSAMYESKRARDGRITFSD